MSILFTPRDVFEIAILIERNGARFYRNAAAHTDDEETRVLLRDLATMEDEHLLVFERLMKKFVDAADQAEWIDKDQENDAFLYLQAFATGQIFDLSRERYLPETATVSEVLDFAMERERESILFYLGIKEWIPPARLGSRIEQIILEEMKHMAQLNKRRLELAVA